MSLFVRVFATNAALLTVAALVLGLSPITVSWPIALTEAVVVALGLAAMLVANFLLLRPTFAPLQRLAGHMSVVDLLRPGQRVSVTGPVEVTTLVGAFNDMLARLEEERRVSGRRALAAQEAERKRIASELHDEVGQAMTGVLMRLERLRGGLPPDRVTELGEAQDAIRSTLEEVRRIAQELRPETLEHLGLVSALTALSRTFASHTGLEVECVFAADLPALDPEAELAAYRVAQEALTNVARHARARRARVDLTASSTDVVLRVVDDGCGFDVRVPHPGGLLGMRERALSVGGQLAISSPIEGGSEVRLALPIPQDRR